MGSRQCSPGHSVMETQASSAITWAKLCQSNTICTLKTFSRNVPFEKVMAINETQFVHSEPKQGSGEIYGKRLLQFPIGITLSLLKPRLSLVFSAVMWKIPTWHKVKIINYCSLLTSFFWISLLLWILYYSLVLTLKVSWDNPEDELPPAGPKANDKITANWETDHNSSL